MKTIITYKLKAFLKMIKYPNLKFPSQKKTIFLALYGDKGEISLNKHRYVCLKKVFGKKNLSSLPPPEDAARLHSLPIYHQVQYWLGNKLLPKNWGWQNAPNLSPITATLMPAPKNIIESFFLYLLQRMWKSMWMPKNGLKCSDICINCCGISSHNTSKIEFEDKEDIDSILLTASKEKNATSKFIDESTTTK